MNSLLWEPSQERIDRALITQFTRYAENQWQRQFANYDSLWQWSVNEPNEFWLSLWQFCGLIGEGETEPVLQTTDRMRTAKWFPQLKLNYAENLLRHRECDSLAIVFRGEDKVETSLCYQELYDQVSVLAQAMRAQGVVAGDRVAGVLPNMPEAIVAMLAAASIGAIWSSCSPDFGVNGILDRFGQIEPKILFIVDGYHYNGKAYRLDKINSEVCERLISLEQVIQIDYLGDLIESEKHISNLSTLKNFVKNFHAKEIEFTPVAFNHPLFIMFSSGTTGVPKCIVHCHGGTLLQHVKEHQLHADIKPGDKLFYFTTCGWMMWNWLVSGLASKATLILYDGSPFYPNGNVLFDYIDDHHITHFGTSAKFIDACNKAHLEPCSTHQLSSVQTVLSTGSVLVPDSFDYVYRAIKQDVCLSSVSGGTDIISCFVGGNPTLPVYRGELQCRALGMDVDVFNEEGKSIVEEKGELMCKKPFPSQPIGFWQDKNDTKYKQAYFERFPELWCQGDYVELTKRNTMIFYGRSDAVLNPGGVRIGTAEIYRQVEALEEIVESLVIGQDWDKDVRVVLFVRLRENLSLSEDLVTKITSQIRTNTTPRHVPAKIIAVTDIPRTKSGKIVELAVKKIVHGEAVKNTEALANPEALELFKDLIELQQ